MPFQKNHEFRWKPEGEKALDPAPVCFKVDPELKKLLKAVPDWQKRLRAELPDMIKKWTAE